MQKSNYQTKDWNNVDSKSLVWKFKLVLVIALLLILVVLTSIAMPFQTAASHGQIVSSHVQTLIIRSTPSGVCNPGPNC